MVMECHLLALFFLFKRTFTVPSINFPGQHHTWRLNPWLQQGSEVAMDSLLTTLAWAITILDLTAKERFFGDWFSIKQSILSFRIGIHRFLGNVYTFWP